MLLNFFFETKIARQRAITRNIGVSVVVWIATLLKKKKNEVERNVASEG